MRVLVTESQPGAASAKAAELEGASHEVVTCFDPAGYSPVCRGMRGGVCPVEVGVDAVVAVRGRPRPTPTHLETGVTCAVRRRVPLVVAGSVDMSPFVAPVLVAADRVGVVEALDRVVGAAAHNLAAAANRAARQLIGRSGGDASDVRSRVEGDGDRTKVTVTVPPVDHPALSDSTLASRVKDAVQAAGCRTAVIDIAIRHTPSPGQESKPPDRVRPAAPESS